MDFLLAGTLSSFIDGVQCRVIVQRRCTSCCSSVENIPLQAERHSARRHKLFAFPPESAFTFRPECCSESQRNRVRLQSGIAFTFGRIPQNTSVLWHLRSEIQQVKSVRHKSQMAPKCKEAFLLPLGKRNSHEEHTAPSLTSNSHLE